MTDFLFGQFGVDIIHFVQSFSSQILDLFFKIYTNFGNVPFYVVALALIYWLYSKKMGAHLAAASLVFGYMTMIIKGYVGWTRPYLQNPPDARGISTATGYSFPSGHSQSTGTFWPVLVNQITNPSAKKTFTVIGIVMIILIPFSRVYLGVHYPGDVTFGLLLGLIGAYLYIKLNQTVIEHFKDMETNKLIILVIVIGLTMFVGVITATLVGGNDLAFSDAGVISGMFIGAFAGFILENKYLNFNEKPSEQLFYFTRLVIGGVITVLCYGIPHVIFGLFDGIYFLLIRHFIELILVGLSIALLSPYAFTKFEDYWTERNKT